MNIHWSAEAVDDLESLRSYIAERDKQAAQRNVLAIIHHVEVILPKNPKIGRVGRLSNSRELIVSRTPFVVPYRIEGELLEILRVCYEAQRFPDIF